MSQWWYVYMLWLDNRGLKTKVGHSKCFYTGMSGRLERRIGDYYFKRGRGYVNTVWRDALRILVYVEHLHGLRGDALRRESAIKKLSSVGKNRLLRSNRNALVSYRPPNIVVRSREGDGSEVVLRME